VAHSIPWRIVESITAVPVLAGESLILQKLLQLIISPIKVLPIGKLKTPRPQPSLVPRSTTCSLLLTAFLTHHSLPRQRIRINYGTYGGDYLPTSTQRSMSYMLYARTKLMRSNAERQWICLNGVAWISTN
jgi:hypothetical protein